MSKHKVGLNGAHEDQADDSAASVQPDAADAAASEAITADEEKSAGGDAMKIAATLGVVVIGAAVLEATLIPGILVGAAAAFAPKFVPKLGERLQPLFNSTV